MGTIYMWKRIIIKIEITHEERIITYQTSEEVNNVINIRDKIINKVIENKQNMN